MPGMTPRKGTAQTPDQTPPDPDLLDDRIDEANQATTAAAVDPLLVDGLATPSSGPYLTTGEVAAQLRVDPATVRRLIGAGDLVAIRVGRDYRIEPAELHRFTGARRTSSSIVTRPNR